MSYNITESFFNATQNREPLIVLAVVETISGKYVYHAGNVTRANLPADPVLDIKKALLSIGGLTETLLSNVTDIYANYTSTEQTQAQITLDDSDKYFSFYLSADTFLNGTCTISIGYPSVAYADMLTLFSGTVDTEALFDGQLQIQATADGSILRQSHVTGRASRYARPKNSDDVLPIVYGTHYDLVRGRGLWTCPCIDTTNQYYLVADHAVLSVANGNNIKVYVNNTLKTTGYTFTPSGTDENGKTIAYLTFSPALADSDVVTCQTHGKIDSDGKLIQHPLDIIKDIVTDAGGSISDFDAYNYAAEYNYATAHNLMAAGILTHQSRLVQELVLEILGSFLASTWVSGQDDVKISFLRETASQNDVMLILSEATCSDYQAERLAANLCNASTFDLVNDSAHNGVLYPNWTPYNIDCDATAGSQYTTMDAGDTWLLTSDLGVAGLASLWIADPKTQTTTRYNYAPGAGWTVRQYHQLPDGSRKRLFMTRASDGAALVYNLDSSYAVSSSTLIRTVAGWTALGYWHDGTTGRVCWTNSAGSHTLDTINASDAYVSQISMTLAGYVPIRYGNATGNRRRLMWRATSGNHTLWTLNAYDAYVSATTVLAVTGYTLRAYWHNGTDGKLIYNNTTTGAPYQRILDANDTDIANVADVAGASAITAGKLSQSRYGVKTRAFDGGWMSSPQTPFAVMRALYWQFSQPRWIVGFITTDTRAQQLERGDLIAYSCDQLRDENALPLVNQIGRILELTRDPIAGTCQIKVLDTGAYLQSSGVRDRTRY